MVNNSIYEQIVLHHVSTDFKLEKVAHGTWKEMFHALLRENEDFRSNFDESFLKNLRHQEETLEEEILNGEQDDLNDYLSTATAEQNHIYDQIMQYPVGIHLVHGSAGVGNSHLLKMLNAGLKAVNFVPYKLAPTGIAATLSMNRQFTASWELQVVRISRLTPA